MGGQHITNDLAIGLRSSIEVAEKVKLMFGHSDIKAVGKNEEIQLSQFEPGETDSVMRHYAVEIIQARLEEILTWWLRSLKISPDGKLPAGVVLTGGVAVCRMWLNLPKAFAFARALWAKSGHKHCNRQGR